MGWLTGLALFCGLLAATDVSVPPLTLHGYGPAPLGGTVDVAPLVLHGYALPKLGGDVDVAPMILHGYAPAPSPRRSP